MGLRFVLVGLALTMVMLAVGCSTNPVTGKREISIYSEVDEVALGANAAPGVEKELGGVLPNPALQAYVNTVGQRVARVSHRPELKYHYAVLNSEVPNAFALPGGYIYITRGLLAELRDESELAAVLGHETGHVTAKHGVNQLQRQVGMQVLLDAVGSATESPKVEAVAKVAANLTSLRYSRENETQSDELGIEYAYKAGYNPSGMVGLLTVLSSLHETEPAKWTEYFQTHPLTDNRIEHAGQYIKGHYPDAKKNAGMRTGKEDLMKATASLRAKP